MASKLFMHSSFYLMLFLLISSNMAIANAALLRRTTDLTFLHIKGHKGHGEARVGRFSAPYYWASLPKGPVPVSGPSLAINGLAPVPHDEASTTVNDDVSETVPSRN